MRITFLVPSLERRGPNLFVLNLISGLLQLKQLEIDVVFIRHKGDLKFPVPSYPLSWKALRRIFASDVVQSTMLLPDLILMLLPISRRKKVIALHNFVGQDLHFTYTAPMSNFLSGLWFLVLRRGSHFIYSSPYMQQYYRRRGIDGRAVLIRYGIPEPLEEDVDIEDRSLLQGLVDRGLRIVGDVCLLIPRKGVDQLVEILALDDNLAVVVVGDGPERDRLEQRAEALGVRDRFLILGFRKNSYRYNVFFDVFAMVSRSEGFCMAMIEAMAYSVPVVCSALPIYEGALGTDTVCHFQVNNIASLYGALQQVLDGRLVYGPRSRDLFKKHFTLTAMSIAHVDYYSSLVTES